MASLQPTATLQNSKPQTTVCHQSVTLGGWRRGYPHRLKEKRTPTIRRAPPSMQASTQLSGVVSGAACRQVHCSGARTSTRALRRRRGHPELLCRSECHDAAARQCRLPANQLTVATGSFLAFCLVDLAPEASTRCSASMKLIAHPLGGEALEDCLATWVQDQGRAPWDAGCISSASRTRAIRSSNRARSCGESMVRSASSAIH